MLRRLARTGVAIVFVSHKLEEVFELCDHVTVLRDGRNACAAQPLAGLDAADVVRLMIGRDEPLRRPAAPASPARAPALELRGVATALGHRDVDLALHRGEILGLYGLVGAGRSELARGDHRRRPDHRRRVLVAGRPARIRACTDALQRFGIGYVSEDRKQEGLILHAFRRQQRRHHDLAPPAPAGSASSRRRSETRAAMPFVRALDVRTPSLAQRVGNLSGGNQQKVSVAKWLAAGAEILIVDEPTVGIDIRTKAYLHDLSAPRARRHRGAADLVRHAGDDRARRPHRRDEGIPRDRQLRQHAQLCRGKRPHHAGDPRLRTAANARLSATEKPDALMALAVAAGLGAVDPWADTAGRIATAIAEILPAETNRGVALRPAATLREDARRLVFPGRARDLRPPIHYHGVPPGFTHASREALSPDVNLLDLADGVFCHLADMPLALTADATVALKDFSSRYAPLLHYYDVDLRRLAADAIAVPGPLLLIADDVAAAEFQPLGARLAAAHRLPREHCATCRDLCRGAGAAGETVPARDARRLRFRRRAISRGRPHAGGAPAPAAGARTTSATHRIRGTRARHGSPASCATGGARHREASAMAQALCGA